MSFFRSKTFIALSILTVAGGVGTFVHVNALVSWEESIRNPAKVGTGGFAEGAFAKENGLFLVSADKSQVNFWNNKFSNNKLGSSNTLLAKNGEAPGDAFALVNKAFSDDVNDRTALNRLCDAAYRASSLSSLENTSQTPQESSVQEHASPTEGTDDQENLVVWTENIWHFCAPKIVTLSETLTAQHDSTKIQDSLNKKALVDTSDSNNEWFWKLRDSEFWTQQTETSRSGSKAKSGSLFHTLYTENKNKDSKPNIKNTCKQAYEQDSNSEPNKTDVFLFCSLYQSSESGDEE